MPGDVGFVVKLTGLWNQAAGLSEVIRSHLCLKSWKARGSSYGVQGYAEQLVAVGSGLCF